MSLRPSIQAPRGSSGTAPASGWHVAIDRGGTFTDVLAVRDGEVRASKVPTADDGSGTDPCIRGIRSALRLEDGVPLDDRVLASVRLGTTAATNALLTRSGARTALVVTRGLGDLPIIGDQSRPRLFELAITRPDPVASYIIEAKERIGADGEVVTPLDEASIRADLAAARSQGCTSLAIVLMHGWKHDAHERRIASIAEAFDFTEVVTSRTSPLRGCISRIDTVSLDASLTPVLHSSVDRTAAAVCGVPIHCMQSSGGLVDVASFRGCRAVLSGPAGGLVAAADEARRHGLSQVIALDMGGTSTDVSWYAGTLERSSDTVIGGVRVRSPMLRVHTVAAGGGSICESKGGRLRVGPASAGATPGPACYGFGGPVTITDCHVFLGRLPVAALPAVFGRDRRSPVDAEAARAALEGIAASLADPHDPVGVAEGFLDVAVEGVAGAIRQVSIEQGHDVRGTALCAFGGAAGQLACRVASRLGIDQVLIPAHAGILSAQGIAVADIAAVRAGGLGCDLGDSRRICEAVDQLQADALGELAATGSIADRVEVTVAVRGHRWDRTIQVSLDDSEVMDRAYRAACLSRFGFEIDGPLIADSVEVRAVAESARSWPTAVNERGASAGSSRMWTEGVWRDVPILSTHPAEPIDGPAVILQPGSTTVVETGWRAVRSSEGGVLLSRQNAPRRRGFDASSPADIEVANRRFLAICREMGTVLQHTASSVNVKERRDYSCAVFDSEGRLVANGPHMPVHLGSMGASVRRVLDVHGSTMAAGDAYVDSDPAHGGTHLPDLTVISPVFHDARCVHLVASRAHHADIGGTSPGSMPGDSTSIEEEGIVFDAEPLVRGGVLLEGPLREKLTFGAWPARQPDVNVDDLRAQIGANTRGMALLDAMRADLGQKGLASAMEAVRRNASECVRQTLRHCAGGKFEASMDDGGMVRVSVEPTAERTIIDFAGTSDQRPGNTNAPLAITRAAVLYVVRCLVDDDIPLNDGCLEPIDLIVPDGCMLAPAAGAAVVGGNVETSQIIVDALLGAFGVQAASQGTMNNLTFGDARLQYYETICGGSGAGIWRGAPFAGASAVHTHMTNSLLTDPEVLEERFPVRVERFGLRPRSGGSGRFSGGAGAIRTLRFLAPMQASLLSGRRTRAPHGIAGGGPGAVGIQTIIRHGGGVQELPGCFRAQVDRGDVLHIETPGGGGYLAE